LGHPAPGMLFQDSVSDRLRASDQTGIVKATCDHNSRLPFGDRIDCPAAAVAPVLRPREAIHTSPPSSSAFEQSGSFVLALSAAPDGFVLLDKSEASPRFGFLTVNVIIAKNRAVFAKPLDCFSALRSRFSARGFVHPARIAYSNSPGIG